MKVKGTDYHLLELSSQIIVPCPNLLHIVGNKCIAWARTIFGLKFSHELSIDTHTTRKISKTVILAEIERSGHLRQNSKN